MDIFWSYEVEKHQRAPLTADEVKQNKYDFEADGFSHWFAETITFLDGDVIIDDQLLSEPYVDGTTRAPLSAIQGEGCTNPPAPDRCTLADGYYFVLGDNRANSTDSRSFGPIAEETIVGRAFLKVWPLGDLGFL